MGCFMSSMVAAGSQRDDVSDSPTYHDTTDVVLQFKPNAAVGAFLAEVPIFTSLNKEDRDKLGGALRRQNFAPGETVFSEGEEGDTFYVIVSGTVTVKQKWGADSVVLAQLQVGDIFGEQSILHDERRNATVTVDPGGDLVLLSLNRAAFQTLFREDRLNVIFADRARQAVTTGEEQRGAPGEGEGVIEEAVRARLATPGGGGPVEGDVKMLVLTAINTSVLFRGLDRDFKEAVASVMYQVTVPAGETVIQQGEEGDRFYVVEEGEFAVFQKNETVPLGINHVDTKHKGECFGDLALLYNAPRNATCAAACDSKVRVLERVLFNRIIRQREEYRLQKYSNWLKQVPLLQPLTTFERMRLAEAMDIVDHEGGVVLTRQGEAGHEMYVVVAGEVAFTVKNPDTGRDERVPGANGLCGPGGYFGERALMHHTPRACTVTTTRRTRVLMIDRAVFESLLGPLEGIMMKKEETYTERISFNVVQWKPIDTPLADLAVLGTLGKGSYGFVQLVEGPDGVRYALKAVGKQRVVETKQKEHMYNEKNLLCKIDHPFLVKLYATYTDQDFLYFLLEPALGGELFRILRKKRAFPPPQSRFYGACVILGFDYLHSKGMVYRDLKPENLLIDTDGYIKITDFGFCKEVVHKTWTMCGTPEYMAPEVVQSKGHDKGVDWWTVGVLIYEMLVSHTPFFGQGDIMDMYQRIIRGHVKYPPHVTSDARELLAGLLIVRPTMRLGCTKQGADAIKAHPWFASLDWEALEGRRLAAPMKIKDSDVSSLAHFACKVEQGEIAPYVDDGTDWDKAF